MCQKQGGYFFYAKSPYLLNFLPFQDSSDIIKAVKKEWIELGGSGIFRPEVVKPLLGFEVPVLAWGLGLERIISDYYNITDLRDYYENDLELLRSIKKWLK